MRAVLLWVGLALGTLFTADLAYAGARIVASLSGIQNDLRTARSVLGSADLVDIERTLRDAARAAGEARRLMDRPSMRILQVFPIADPDVLMALTDAGRAAAEAGLEIVDALDAAGVDSDLVSAMYRDGTVDLSVARRMTPAFVHSSDLLHDAHTRLVTAGTPALSPLEAAHDQATRELASAAGSADRIRALFAGLPALLGDGAKQRYLLAFQAPSEARATGGVVGLVATLAARDGRLRLEDVEHHSDLGNFPIPAVDAPDWFKEAYGSQSALSQWQQANVSPNFPAVAQVLLNMYEHGTGQQLDGVIAMDPAVLADVLTATGPLDVNGQRLTAANAGRYLMRDLYLEVEPSRQNAVLRRIVTSFWLRIQSGRFRGAPLARRVASAVTSSRMKLYARDASQQRLIDEMGASGWPAIHAHTQMVFHNNYAANKIDFFLRRFIDTDIKIDERGDGVVTTRIELQNRSPDEPPSLLIGDGTTTPLQPGINRMVLNLLMPAGSEPKAMRVGREEVDLLTYDDESNPVAWTLMELPAGDRSVLKVSYVIPDLVQFSAERGEFVEMMFWPQSLPNEDHLSLRFTAPSGYAFVDQEGLASRSRSVARWEGVLDSPRSVLLVLRPEQQ
ncbi:MAG: DUF4012 domain-containing protein [Actinomycetota bacterium]|nr:DUF4012 domain-containing protein [Actinomycetota bacterium]